MKFRKFLNSMKLILLAYATENLSYASVQYIPVSSNYIFEKCAKSLHYFNKIYKLHMLLQYLL